MSGRRRASICQAQVAAGASLTDGSCSGDAEAWVDTPRASQARNTSILISLSRHRGRDIHPQEALEGTVSLIKCHSSQLLASLSANLNSVRQVAQVV